MFSVMDNVSENMRGSKGLLHFKEKSWSNWIKEVTESRVYRLPYHDMSLYGVRPEIDTFSAVICSTCGKVVKAPALKRHIELQHPEETQLFLAPKQVAVRKSRPNILRKPTKSPVPVENSICHIPANIQDTTVKNNTPTTVQSITAVNSEDNLVTVNSKSPVLSVAAQLESTARRKSPPHSERKRAREKDKDKEDEHGAEKGSSSHDTSFSPSSSARTTPKQLQKRSNNNNNSETTKSSVRTTNSSSNVTSSSKQTVDKYIKKSSNVAVWGGQQEVGAFQVNYPISTTVLTSVQTNINNILVLEKAQQPSQVKCSTEAEFSLKNYSVSSTSIPTPVKNEWPSSHIEKMLFPDVDMGESLVPPLVPSETPEPLPESSSTPQVLTAASAVDSQSPVELRSVTPPASQQSGGGGQATLAIPAPAPVIQSPNIPSIDPPILDVDMLINSVHPFTAPTQLLKVMPPSAPSYSFKVSSSNPVLILSPKDPALPAVNLNVNSESTKTVITKQMIPSSSNPASILKPRAVKVPITVQMPLQEKVTNITFYKRYPKPITISNFSGKKIGGALIFNTKRVNVVRNDFKTVLNAKKGKGISTVTLKSCPPGMTGSTIYTAKPLTPNNNCRFPQTISVIPNPNANTLVNHRPNILRASLPKHGGQHVSKILASGLKRVATSSQQNDCKHLLLTPGNVNGQCFLGRIVHPRAHETTDHAVSDTAPHILEKVVPVNTK